MHKTYNTHYFPQYFSNIRKILFLRIYFRKLFSTKINTFRLIYLTLKIWGKDNVKSHIKLIEAARLQVSFVFSQSLEFCQTNPVHLKSKPFESIPTNVS